MSVSCQLEEVVVPSHSSFQALHRTPAFFPGSKVVPGEGVMQIIHIMVYMTKDFDVVFDHLKGKLYFLIFVDASSTVVQTILVSTFDVLGTVLGTGRSMEK